MKFLLSCKLFVIQWLVLGMYVSAFCNNLRLQSRTKPRFVHVERRSPEASIFAYTVDAINTNDKIPLRQYYGKKVYVAVNVATQSDLASQHFSELQTLYDRYKNSGLEILAFPSETFGNELESNEEIDQQLINKFKVTFPVFGKLECQNGLFTHPLYKYLSRSVDNGLLGIDIRRDFVRFLCNDRGVVVKRYHPNTSPLTMESRIRDMIAAYDGHRSDRKVSETDWYSKLYGMKE